MALVQAGKQFTADDLKRAAGDTAGYLALYLENGLGLKAQLESFPDADLVALGLSQDEINAIKGFYIGDLPAISQAFSTSAWVKQLLGTGV